MGFTVEDMLTVSRDRYSMELIAGENGWSNSISWLLNVEDFTIIRNFRGKELAVTTALGFQKESDLKKLVRSLSEHNASGLIVNTGFYIKEIPASVIRYCNRNDLPLLTVPWDIYIADMIKDLSIRVFLQGATDEQITAAFIQAIERPEAQDQYIPELLAHFDTDGTFQVMIFTTRDLDKMDTVERRRIAYRLQLFLTNITHNGHFFYYDGCFVLIMNAVGDEDAHGIIESFAERVRTRMPGTRLSIGVGSAITDVTNLHIAYRRAKAALTMAQDQKKQIIWFDERGVGRLLYSVSDRRLLHEFSEALIGPLAEHDQKHASDYVKTLELYLENDESIQKVAELTFSHRNTITYRMRRIRDILGCEISTADEKMEYRLACMIRHMKTGIHES